MRRGLIIVFLSFLLLPGTAKLQIPCEDLGITDTLGFNTVINVDDGIIDPGDDFCVSFTTENFNFVIGFQYTFAFDPSVICFLSLQTTPGVLLGPIGPNFTQANDGVISMIWTNLNAEGQTLPDGQEILTLCFNACGQPNDCSPLYFNNDYPFYPELEVNYQIDEFTTCTDTIILLDGEEQTQIKIECTELTIIDIQTCNANPTNGSLSFSACGGTLPYTYEVTTSFSPVVLSGTINQDGEVVFYGTVPSGLFTITVTDADGNMSTRTVNIESGPALDYDVTVIEPNCPEAETGKIIISDIRGGVPGLSGYEMAASTGQFFLNTFGDSLIRLGNGNYDISITDDNGCMVSESFTLNTPEMDLIIEIDTASCFGSSDGAVRVFPSGGTPFAGGEYIINGTQSTMYEVQAPFLDTHFFSIDNKFVITVQDANGCIVEERIDIPTFGELEVEISELIDVACKGESTGSARIIVLTPGRYVFLLTDEIGNFVPAVGSVIGNIELFYDRTLPEGFYNLTITETTIGCQLDTFFVINEPPTELVLTSGGVSPDCNANDGIAFVQATGGMAPYSYDWPIAPGSDNDSIYNLIPGVYNVNVTDDLGCTVETQATIMPGDNLDIEIDIVNSLNCDGTGQGMIEANIINSTYPNLVYNWTNPAGDMLGSNTSLTFNSPGEYILIVTDPNMICMDSDTVFIDPAGVFTFDIAFIDPPCIGSAGGEVLISNFQGGVGPYFCEWEDTTITDCNPTTLSSGTYFLTISDNAGCRIDTFIQLFDSGTEITFDLDIQDPTCREAIDGSISFLNFSGGNGPYECQWEDQSIIGCPRTGLPAGNYPVTITNADGCEKDTIITLTDPEAIGIAIVDSDIVDVSCFEGSDGQATVNITNNPSGASSFNFSWSNPADDDSGGLTDNAIQLSAGLNYVLAFDDNSCISDTVFFMVNQPEKLQLDLAGSSIESTSCKGECDGAATLQAMGGTINSGNYELLWEDGTSSASNSGLCPGIYYITISDDIGCMELDSIEIIEPDTLTVEIDLNGTVNLSCFGDESGAIQVRSNGGCGGYIYTWTNNVATDALAENLSQGTYTITVTDDCGCTDITQYTLESSEEIVAQTMIPEMPDCFGSSTCIGIESASGGVGSNYTYSINFGERIPIDSCVEVIAGLYTLTVFDAVGCSQNYTTTVEQPEQIDVDLGPDIILDLGDSTTTITANINGPNPIDSINWNSNSGFNCIDPSCTTITVNATIFSTYEVVVVDTNGCEGRDKIDVSISANRNVYVPNILNSGDFPPNDKFMLLTGEGVIAVEYLRIFDRWGNLVFEKENIPHPTSIDEGWDGRKDNKIVEQGVYIYVAEVRFVDNKLIQYKGDITVIR